MPLIKDYYEPWNYNYEHLTTAKSGSIRQLLERIQKYRDNIEIEWGPNWEDDLAGGHVTGPKDPNIQK